MNDSATISFGSINELVALVADILREDDQYATAASMVQVSRSWKANLKPHLDKGKERYRCVHYHDRHRLRQAQKDLVRTMSWHPCSGPSRFHLRDMLDYPSVETLTLEGPTIAEWECQGRTRSVMWDIDWWLPKASHHPSINFIQIIWPLRHRELPEPPNVCPNLKRVDVHLRYEANPEIYGETPFWHRYQSIKHACFHLQGVFHKGDLHITAIEEGHGVREMMAGRYEEEDVKTAMMLLVHAECLPLANGTPRKVTVHSEVVRHEPEISKWPSYRLQPLELVTEWLSWNLPYIADIKVNLTTPMALPSRPTTAVALQRYLPTNAECKSWANGLLQARVPAFNRPGSRPAAPFLTDVSFSCYIDSVCHEPRSPCPGSTTKEAVYTWYGITNTCNEVDTIFLDTGAKWMVDHMWGRCDGVELDRFNNHHNDWYQESGWLWPEVSSPLHGSPPFPPIVPQGHDYYSYSADGQLQFQQQQPPLPSPLPAAQVVEVSVSDEEIYLNAMGALPIEGVGAEPTEAVREEAPRKEAVYVHSGESCLFSTPASPGKVNVAITDEEAFEDELGSLLEAAGDEESEQQLVDTIRTARKEAILQADRGLQ